MIDQKLEVFSLGTARVSASSWETAFKPEYKEATKRESGKHFTLVMH